MRIIPLGVKDAEAFLAKHDRHYKAPVEAICAIGVGEDVPPAGSVRLEPTDGPIQQIIILHGAAILGRKDDETAELAHIYVDGASQGYSLLYGACWRALKALGYKRAVL